MRDGEIDGAKRYVRVHTAKRTFGVKLLPVPAVAVTVAVAVVCPIRLGGKE